LIALLGAGCGSTGKRDPDRDRYVCEGGGSFSADVGKRQEWVWVQLPTHAFRMDRVQTEAGESYVRGANRLSIDDGVATLVLADGTGFSGCRRPDARS
jgi:hypothetical protein